MPLRNALLILAVCLSAHAAAQEQKRTPFLPGEVELLSAVFKLESARDWNRITPAQEEEDLRVRANLKNLYAHLPPDDVPPFLLERARGSGPGEMNVGAAMYLCTFKGEKIIPLLLKGMDVELPGGVMIACMQELGRRCTGEFMQECVNMFLSADEDTKTRGFRILTAIPTKKQLAELEKVRRTKDPKGFVKLQPIIDIVSGKALK